MSEILKQHLADKKKKIEPKANVKIHSRGLSQLNMYLSRTAFHIILASGGLAMAVKTSNID